MQELAVGVFGRSINAPNQVRAMRNQNSNTKIPQQLCTLVPWVCAFVAILSLGACGGGSNEFSATEKNHNAQTTKETGWNVGLGLPLTHANPSAQTVALQEEGARLSAAELVEITRTGVLPESFEGTLLSGEENALAASKKGLAVSKEFNAERKGAASRTAVYRFFNTRTKAHFFTTSVSERNNVQATLSHMSYEGTAFYASGTTIPGLSPVHRFYNAQTGVHFYTISEAERAHVASTLPQFVYEGIAYYASTLAGTGYTPLYRFFYPARGFHFYTNSAAEKDNIIATLPQYSYEGVGYYVLGSDWQTPAVPHSGVTASQCYQAGSNTLVACSTAGALALNPQQDGHRTAINPMRYSDVVSGYFGTFPIIFPLYYPRTDCVRDDVTGLVWEGKAASGERSGANTYTYHGDNRSGDASAYVNRVNALNLCGFNDWRLPEAEELHNLVNYGLAGSGPRITMDWFPNAENGASWSSTPDAVSTSFGWTMSFTADAGIKRSFRSHSYSVRLVRGQAWNGTRHVITSKPYPGDGVNNAVIDRKTGLIWRRCLEGQLWSEGACTYNTSFHLSQEGALTQGSSRSGWRVPNVKELASLPDRGRVSPSLDVGFFPGAVGSDLWTSTPHVGSSSYAMRVGFSAGGVSTVPRENISLLRLVGDGS